MIPDFLIIGAPKCGTSALAAYLDAHPEVCFSRPKEPHYFYRSPAIHCLAESYPEYVTRFFPHYEAARHRITGEGTPRILESPGAVEAVEAVNPRAKFVVLVRDPVDLFFSWHQEMRKGLMETEPDPARAWDLQDERKRGRAIPATCGDPRSLYYADICAIGSHLERLHRHVDAARIHAISQRDLRDHPDTTLATLCEFLGISRWIPERPPRENVTGGCRSETALRLYRAAFRLKQALAGTRPLPGWIPRTARSLLFTRNPGDRTPADPAFRARLEEILRPEREKLAARGLLPDF